MSLEIPGGPARELARVLARRLRDRDGSADGPMTVAELRRELLPYPRCREPAGLASKAEYDLAVLDLLAAPAILRVEDPELADAVEEERGAAEPGLGFLEDFAASTLRPGPALTGAASREAAPPGEAAAAGEAAPAGDEASPPDRGSAPDPGDASPAADAGPSHGPGRPPEPGQGPDAVDRDACRACGGEVPGRDGLRFCPWCGEDLTASRCGDCGEEMEPDWSFCPTCGTPAPARGD